MHRGNTVYLLVILVTVLAIRTHLVVCEGFMNIANLLRIQWLISRDESPQVLTGLRQAIGAYELATRCMNVEKRRESLANLAYWRLVIGGQDNDWSESVPICQNIQTNRGPVRGGSFNFRRGPLALRNEVWLRLYLPDDGLGGSETLRLELETHQQNLVTGTFVGEWRARQGTPPGYRPHFPVLGECYSMVSEDSLRGIVAEVSRSSVLSTSTVRSIDTRVTGGGSYLLAAQVRAVGGTQARLAVAWFADKPQGSMPTHRLKVEYASVCQTNQDGWDWLVCVGQAPSDASFAQIWLQNQDSDYVRFTKVIFLPLPLLQQKTTPKNS